MTITHQQDKAVSGYKVMQGKQGNPCFCFGCSPEADTCFGLLVCEKWYNILMCLTDLIFERGTACPQ